jgi:hypothetical protein
VLPDYVSAGLASIQNRLLADPLLQHHLHGQAAGLRAPLQEEPRQHGRSPALAAPQVEGAPAVAVQEDLGRSPGMALLKNPGASF